MPINEHLTIDEVLGREDERDRTKETFTSSSERVGPKSPFTAIYDQDYFSGSQCSIYVGDVWVDEITSFSYSTSQQKTPIYGYASQLLDDVAPGQVIVQGNFTINYKEQGYLWAVLGRYKKLFATENEVQASPVGSVKMRVDTRAPSESGGPSVGHERSSRATIERLLGGKMTQDQLNEAYLSIAGNVTFDTNSPQDRVFENLTEAFEDQVWGDNNTGNNFNSQIRRTDSNRFDDFDIYVVFGNYQNDMSNHTAQKIQGVRLLSQGKQIVVGGAPIQESYEFLAKTVV